MPAANPGDQTLTVDAVALALREVLKQRLDPDSLRDLVIRWVSVNGSRVTVRFAVQVSGSDELAELEAALDEHLRWLGATDVEVISNARTGSTPRSPAGTAIHGWADQVRVATVRHVIAVGAGKGGVGKSTVAVNLALALCRTAAVDCRSRSGVTRRRSSDRCARPVITRRR